MRLLVAGVAVLLSTGAHCAAQEVKGGRVVYNETRTPLARGFIFYDGRRGRIEEDGTFRIELNSDSVAAQIACWPRRRLGMGRILGPYWLRPAPDGDTLRVLFIEEDACYEPPETRQAVEVAGEYVAGFEVSSFQPCKPFADLSRTAYGVAQPGAWLDLGGNYDQLPKPRRFHVLEGGWRHAVWFLRLRGELVGPGGYGHLGGSHYILHVDTILSAGPPSPHACRDAATNGEHARSAPSR